ncbi:MAG: hypothetical protein ACLP8S_15785 [Solirubrobacteraceae bacterium]
MAPAIRSSHRLKLNILSNHRGNPEGRLQEPCQPNPADHTVCPAHQILGCLQSYDDKLDRGSVASQSSHAEGLASGVEE